MLDLGIVQGGLCGERTIYTGVPQALGFSFAGDFSVLPGGTCDILGPWIEHTEGATFWITVRNDLKTRGIT